MRFEDVDRDRVKAAAGAVLLQAVLVYALIRGLAVGMPAAVGDTLKLFTIPPERPPPVEKPIPPKVRSRKPEGAAAPPNLKSKATEVTAPVPIIAMPVPPPIIVAPVAATGVQASSGASDRPGPGTGSGGQGNGTGSGGRGDGDGGGDFTAPRWKKGRIKDSDYPAAAAEAGFSGTVTVRYLVDLDGRAADCVITRSSGNREIDETTCRLIEQRFRYEPSKDPDGRPVRSYIVKENEWVIERHSDGEQER